MITMPGLNLRKMSIQHLADVPTLHRYGCQMEHIRHIPGFWTAGRPKACYPLTFQTMWIYRGIYGWIGILDQLVPRCRANKYLNRYINFICFVTGIVAASDIWAMSRS